MTDTRHIILFCITCFSAWTSFAGTSRNDSLRNLLQSTSDAKKRIGLLIDLKDLNENNGDNFHYSKQLFDEAHKAGDIYAMSVGANTYILRFANYPEKQDSIRYYIETFHSAAKGTLHEGHSYFWEMYVLYRKLMAETDKDGQRAFCKYITAQIAAGKDENRYQKTGRLFLEGVIDETLNPSDASSDKSIRLWIEAWDIASGMPEGIYKPYLSIIYHHLSTAYDRLGDYKRITELANRYIAEIDKYYASNIIKDRRKLLYKDNTYALSYKQLLYGAAHISESEAYEYFDRVRRRMMSAEGEHLRTNKMFFYEISYGFMDKLGHTDQSIAYCDSLLSLIKGRGAIKVQKDMARLLRKAGRSDEALAAYAKTMHLSDSIKAAEYVNRLDQIRSNNDFEKLKLEETELGVAYRRMLTILSACILIILTVAGIRYWRILKKTTKLQAAILRQTQKAGESEHMKSVFINSLCNEIRTPFDAINEAAEKLTSSRMPQHENIAYHKSIAENTHHLTQMLEGLLEAAELTSLSEGLPLKKTDIAKICQKEMAAASINPKIIYKIEDCEKNCIADTHPKYFALVIRSLLDNANKSTAEGEISIGGHKDEQNNTLHIIISDTGCGIPADKTEHVFEYFPQLGALSSGNGLGLPICRFIAHRLHGDLSIDRRYTSGARLIFTIPIMHNHE